MPCGAHCTCGCNRYLTPTELARRQRAGMWNERLIGMGLTLLAGMVLWAVSAKIPPALESWWITTACPTVCGFSPSVP